MFKKIIKIGVLILSLPVTSLLATTVVSGTVSYTPYEVTGAYLLTSATVNLMQDDSVVQSQVLTFDGSGTDPQPYSFTVATAGSYDVVIDPDILTGWFGDTKAVVLSGSTVTANLNLVHAHFADLDMDGQCWDSDMDILNGNYGRTNAIWYTGDSTGDGIVNDNDFPAWVSGSVSYTPYGISGAYHLTSVTVKVVQGATVLDSTTLTFNGSGTDPKPYNLFIPGTGAAQVVIEPNYQTGWFGDTKAVVLSGSTVTADLDLQHALPGDADMDGQCWDSDVDIVNGCYGITDGTAVWCIGDFDDNGNVYDEDVDILNGCYGLGHEE